MTQKQQEQWDHEQSLAHDIIRTWKELEELQRDLEQMYIKLMGDPFPYPTSGLAEP